MEILLHVRQLTELDAARLAEGGVIAVEVADLDAVRFVSTETSSFRTDDFLWALLDSTAEVNSFNADALRRFMRNLRTLADEARSKRMPKPREGAEG